MDSLLVLARSLHIGSAALLVSLIFFQKIILRERKGGVAPTRWPDFLMRRLRRWTIATFALQFLSGATWLWIVTAQMNDSSLGEAFDWNFLHVVLTQTQFGQLWMVRFVVALVLALVLFLEGRSATPRQPGWTLFVMGGLLLGSLAGAGHAAAGTNDRTLHIAVDLAHLAVVAVWPVGLIPLAIFLFTLRKTNTEVPVSVLLRFSRASLLGVIFLMLTGLGNALFFIPSLDALFDSTYGQLLIGKIVLFLAMAGIGARNRFSLLPGFVNDPLAPGRLRWAVLLESTLCLIVLLIVGVLGATPPPQS